MSISIGVVIPTFNRPDQTVEAVASAMRQSRPPDQIVVIDDGSQADKIENLMSRLPRTGVEVVVNPHCGHPGRVRNVGLGRLETSHVAFLDSDDLWIRNKLEIQERLALRGSRAIGSGYILRDKLTGENAAARSASRRVTLRGLLADNVICNSSVLLEVQLLHEIGGLPISYGVRGIEDYAAWLRIATLTDWTFILDPLVIYNDDPLNSMRGTNHFSIPENVLALWDFVAWLQQGGREVPGATQFAIRASNRMLREWAARQ